ncbi:MAG TPA: pirin family protein [Tepidisphaeraceae bacterium]|jgi:redox-sensitive bicupin YhaK (pirin superfamily)|nr:pirin family protein [Tepidisphaeraceae bacterium]
MINIIPSEKRYHADHGWLDTRWHFSFGDYHDPANMGFSKLRVFNDDIVQGGGGFGMHPHRGMEIITYMISGELRHQDSLGNGDVLRPGEVQVMSAGKGIMHAEFNNSKTDPLRLLQIWILPLNKGLKPRWAQQRFTREQRSNKLLPVVSSGNVSDTLTIDQDAAVYVSSLSAGNAVTHASTNRHIYLFIISGEATVNERPLQTGDQARIENEPTLNIKAKKDSEIILLDLP